MIIRSKAPLRIGFAGGGTDLESFSNVYGGAVLSAAVSMYAYCTIIPTDTGRIQIYSADNKNDLETKSVPRLDLDGDKLILHRGVYNRIVTDFNGGRPLSFIMSTRNDAPVSIAPLLIILSEVGLNSPESSEVLIPRLSR